MPEETTVEISQSEPEGSGTAVGETDIDKVFVSKKEPYAFKLLFKPKEWQATHTGKPQIIDLERPRGDSMYPLIYELFIQDAYAGLGAEPVDLTGLRVEFAYRIGSEEPTIITGNIYGDTLNKVCFSPKEDDFARAGNFLYDVQVVQAETQRATIVMGNLKITNDINKT